MPCSVAVVAAGATGLGLVFAPALAAGARALTLTLPDLVSTPVTRAGALHATVELRPDRG
jgi:hypothetical protein